MTAQKVPLGEGVRLARTLHGVTQGDLAEATGCSRMTIISIEHGATNPGFMLAFLLARTLKISLDDLTPNITPNTCLCHLYGPEECRVCFPSGYLKK